VRFREQAKDNPAILLEVEEKAWLYQHTIFLGKANGKGLVINAIEMDTAVPASLGRGKFIRNRMQQ
jgi:hypothetical protein